MEAEFGAVSDDGTRIFLYHEPLVPEDTDSCPDYRGPGCVDIYERSGDALRLVSTGPAGNRDDFDYFLSGISKDGSHVFFGPFNGSSEDGKRVFFTTNESLVPEDHDCVLPLPGRDPPGCPDVYERYRGVTSLITRGTVDCINTDFGFEPLCPAFVGASKDGRRVFFVTPESLVSEDTDALNDLYVAIAPSRACRPGKPGKGPKKCGSEERRR